MISSLGLAQYSGDPRIEWHLNAYGTKDAVLDAVRNLPYKGGNTLTGTVWFVHNAHKTQNAFKLPNIILLAIYCADTLRSSKNPLYSYSFLCIHQ